MAKGKEVFIEGLGASFSLFLNVGMRLAGALLMTGFAEAHLSASL